jgi:hypothetical protein
LVICFLWVISAASGMAQQYDMGMIPYRKGELWGYCNPAKKVIIKPMFQETALFEGALAMAKSDSDYCVINKKGEVIYESNSYTGIINHGRNYVTYRTSYNVQLFDERGQAVTKMYNRIEGRNNYGYTQITAGFVKVGLMDSNFKEVLEPQFGSIVFYSPRLLKVYEDKKGYGLYDLSAHKLLAGGYGHMYQPAEGLIMVEQGGLYGFIDTNGHTVIAPMYKKETPVEIARGENYNESTYEHFNFDGFYGGLAVVVDGDLAGYIDRTGKVVIGFKFEKAFGFDNGRAWVRLQGKWGIIDRSGKYVLQPQYKSPDFLYAKELTVLGGFSNGLIAVCIDSLHGYADTNGKLVIPYRYKRAEPFYDELAAVWEGENMGFIDRAGKWVVTPRYKWAEGVGQPGEGPFTDGTAIALLPADKWVVIDKRGNQVLPMQFDLDNNIWFDDGQTCATANGKRYVFSRKGQLLYTFSGMGIVGQYTKDLFYDYDQKCFVNIKTKMRYCD